MSYIGNSPTIGAYTKLDSISSGFNGVTTTFALTAGSNPVNGGSANNCIVSINGVLQEPFVSYSVTGSSITFTEAPTSGMTFFGIVLGNVYDIGIPSDNTVTNAKIVGPITVANGGTGNATGVNLIPNMTGNQGKVLVTDGSTASWGTGTPDYILQTLGVI